MSDTRHAILEQLARGAIGVEEAAAQLNLLRTSPSAPPAPEPPAPPQAPQIDKPTAEELKAAEPEPAATPTPDAGPEPTVKPRRLRIQITDRLSEQRRVNISLPLGLVRLGLQLGEQWQPRLQGMSWSDLRAALEDESGVLMDVDDEHQHVEIRIE